ncbi:MAG: M18 family aminopeptidase, partial [Oscillospiraceae bacterium]|nr:M18 family aminopeptidase [Oscillospiraceae bacterium]
IGLPQLAMHSAYETAGSKDTEYLVSALKLFFESAVAMRSDGCYDII